MKPKYDKTKLALAGTSYPATLNTWQSMLEKDVPEFGTNVTITAHRSTWVTVGGGINPPGAVCSLSISSSITRPYNNITLKRPLPGGVWNIQSLPPFEVSYSDVVSAVKRRLSSGKSRDKKKVAIQQTQQAVFGAIAPHWKYYSKESSWTRRTWMNIHCPNYTGRYKVEINMPNCTDPIKIMILRDRLEELVKEVINPTLTLR